MGVKVSAEVLSFHSDKIWQSLLHCDWMSQDGRKSCVQFTALSLDVASLALSFNQSECFVSAYLIYALLKTCPKSNKSPNLVTLIADDIGS